MGQQAIFLCHQKIYHQMVLEQVSVFLAGCWRVQYFDLIISDFRPNIYTYKSNLSCNSCKNSFTIMHSLLNMIGILIAYGFLLLWVWISYRYWLLNNQSFFHLNFPVIDIDSVGTFTMCHEALKHLKKGGRGEGPSTGGLILNISATLHYTAAWYQIHASAAKVWLNKLQLLVHLVHLPVTCAPFIITRQQSTVSQGL